MTVELTQHLLGIALTGVGARINVRRGFSFAPIHTER
jgi:hypothetical protein